MTHLYTLLIGGRIDPGPGRPPATALVVAAGTVLLVGSDAEAAAISRGDSTTVDLAGARIVATGALEIGAPADFDVMRPDGVARVRQGHLVDGTLPGWDEHSGEIHETGT
jgi:hypothetical protein